MLKFGVGKVFIVGGGPGDPGLITVKGLKVLQQADVVLYDRLVAPELLGEVPTTAELIDVGKEPTLHRRTQAEINALLIEKALAGKIVVRLKGGDPFVFGRGGEECLALAEAGIPFEVVPGVSSAVAVPAYAGIPVTHREVAAQFTVMTGHAANESSVDWSLVPQTGTLIFLMGVKHLPAIVNGLLLHGWLAHTPAAVIEKGTTADQRVVVGSLQDIVEKAGAENVVPPAILVIGEVVALQSSLNWFHSDSGFMTSVVASEPAAV